jgi:hypothetical protein
MSEKDPTKLGAATIRRIAVESDTDPRSVKNVLAGLPVKGMAGERIRRVLAHRRIEIKPKETT